MSPRQFFAIPVDTSGESTRLVRAALFVIVFFLGGAAAWAAWAPISGAVVAAGIVKVDTNRKSVQHLEGGIIQEIRVKEGEQVEAGQPLILLEDTDASAQLNILTDALHAHLAKEARLLAEASLRESFEFPEELTRETSKNAQVLMHNEKSLFAAKRKTLLDQIGLIEEEIRHAVEAATSLQSQNGATQDGVRYVEEQLKAGERLIEKRAIDNNSLLELKRKLAEQKQALWEQRADISLRHQSITELKRQVVVLRNDYMKSAEDEYKDTRQLLLETRERIRPILDALQRKTIRAPIAGQVINLQASTIGGVIRPGDTILELVPKVRDLIFEVRIRPQDSDAVHVGQAAKIQLSAFNQRTTPMVDGALTYLSGDAITLPDSQDKQPFFLAHIAGDQRSLKLPDDRVLSPGMPVVAYVQTTPRTFFEYILSPITSGMRQALVEDMQ